MKEEEGAEGEGYKEEELGREGAAFAVVELIVAFHSGLQLDGF